MLEFRERHRVRKILYSPITMVLLGVVAVVFVKATWNVYDKEAQSRGYLDQTQIQLNKVLKTKSELSASVSALNTKEGMEAEIRSKFLVGRDGEQVAVMVDPDAAASTSAANSSASSTPGFWSRFFGFLR